MNLKSKIQNGFTLIEIVISISLVSIISAISVPVYINFQTTNELEVTKNEIVLSLRMAQSFSRTQNSDSGWGVEIQTGIVSIFKGAVFSTRDITFDSKYTISNRVSITGLSEVIFTKLTGDPLQSGTITLQTTNNLKTISINSKGVIND